MTCDVQAGGVYKIPFPFNEPTSGKARPALALSDPDSRGDVRFLFITTVAPGPESEAIKLEPGDFEGATLPLDGYLHFDKPFLLPQVLAIKHWARLTTAAMARIHRAVIARDVQDFVPFGLPDRSFTPGATPIPPSGKLIGTPEIQNLVEASLDGWLTTGRFNEAFEKRLARYLGVRRALTVNSGSSANLLALAALTSPKLGNKALKPGDEVITVAAGFPTTVNPILLYGLVPVFVDIHIPTYNIDPARIEAAVGPRTRAIMLAHTLGNPFDVDEVLRIARKHDLWVIEDCCDALGSTYSPANLPPSPLERLSQSGNSRVDKRSASTENLAGEVPAERVHEIRQSQNVGTFGHIGTLSFYPAHHITMGEGGAVFTQNPKLAVILESFRDWGRDCFCAPGQDNSCGKRFGWQLGELPEGYDHKYTYSHLGYNLKITDMQAAVALAQMDRLEGFIAARKRNFAHLSERLAPLEDRLILPVATPNSDPSWFGYPITLRPESGIRRVDLLRYLDDHKIGTRLLFAGNLTRQPYMQGRDYRMGSDLRNSDLVMNQTFWIGVQPALTGDMLDYSAERLTDFMA
jgi:CDP-6-deoxy-D-xylo-4-hexulose-3-dehydrase